MIEYGPILALVILAIIFAVNMLPESPEEALRKFKEECRKQGMDFAETQAAIAIRIAMVQLRRLASDQCVKDRGEITRKQMNDIAGRLAIGIAAAHGERAGKTFIGWVDTCEDEEILYDDARYARHAATVARLKEKGLYPPKAGMSQDFKDAFKIVKG